MSSPVSLSTYATANTFPVSFSTYSSAQTHPAKDFSKLLRPEIYHPLTHLTTPPPFRNSSRQPSPDTPLPQLLATGHFRAAAIAAAQALTTSTSPSNYEIIFSLLYIRLACLTLCGSTALAAQEATSLEDLSSSIYRDEISGGHLVPWELRILAVRLQGIGFNDPRKGVMGYYDLAREARSEISKIKHNIGNEINAEREMWEARLADLGVRVASALVEMEDLEGATHHLKLLSSSNFSATFMRRLNLQKAILWLRVGNPDAALLCISEEDTETTQVVSALLQMADGNYSEAVKVWNDLCEKSPSSNTISYAQNLAVCLLYTGRMSEAREIFETLIQEGNAFHALTFNLCTIYELCTDRSRAAKIGLADKVAGLSDEDGLGWEKSLLDFKL